jgi:hypothetical protein
MSRRFELPFDEPEPAASRPAAPPVPATPTPQRGHGRAGAQAAYATPATQATPATTTPAAPGRQVLTVTELTVAIRDHLESEFFSVWVEGEVSNCKLWNGHLYFTLKDERSQLRGFMFRTQLRYLKFKPVDGLRVVARGRISVYEPKGEYQIACEHL